MNNPSKSKSIGEIEAEFTNQIVKFEKEYLGRGPVEAKTILIEDMAIVRLRGVLTPAEKKLIENSEGRNLVKGARRQLFDTSRSIIETYVKEILETDMVDMFSDISLDSGERVIVLTLEKKFFK